MAAALPATQSSSLTHTRASGSRPIIEVRDLVKVYGAGRGFATAQSVRAVDGISFSIAEGEFFGFLGPNGSGKTTTIKIVTTLLGRTSGSVSVAGFDLDRDGPTIRQRIGYAGQSIGVDGDLTGRENLTLMGHLYHLPRDLIKERVNELLNVLQLTEAADRPAYTYSGGMRRRLDLGSGLVHRPKILFLDEPTTGLDPQTRNAVWEYLRRVHREDGVTVFLTTQYMEEADQLCERVAIIDHGRIVAGGTPAELKADIGADSVTIRLPQDEKFELHRTQALEVVSSVAGVADVAPSEQGVTVHAHNGGATLVEILRLLEARHIPVKEVAVSPPTLDQVFLKHTGREMRVEEVKPMTRPGMPRRGGR
ncbi:MAG: ATP-binding cassette domain-containing protein [Thermoplasmata archaeon]